MSVFMVDQRPLPRPQSRARMLRNVGWLVGPWLFLAGLAAWGPQ